MMKKLLHLLTPILLTLTLLLCMVACGNTEEKDPIEPGIYTLSTAYEVAVKNGFDGTLAEFVESIRGLAIEFRTNDTVIQWRYEGTAAWYDLVAVEKLVGPKGEKGDTGAQGEKGDTGAQGAQGEKGEKGDTGAQGAQGEKGEKGDTGAQGAQGEKGEKGDTGAQGAQGEKGEKGDTGAQGAQGEKGEKGDTGAQGVQGEKGEKGDTGAQGVQGEKGEKGDTGAQGAQGEKGEKGDTGAQGPQGEKGEKGDTLIQGGSAYEIFKKYHPEYTGTEEEWILAIVTGNYCVLLGHKWDNGTVTTPATKVADGVMTYTCTVCKTTRTEPIPKIEVADAELYTVDGIQYVNYGKYPQTHVGDETLIRALNTLSETNALGYYEYEGKEYAKITTTSSDTGTYIDKYGESRSYVYSDGATVKSMATEWFLVEPIVWRVLSSAEGNYQLISARLIDASYYYENSYVRKDDEDKDIYSSNYKESTIRAYLNGVFLNTVFNEMQRNAILTTVVDNSAVSTASSDNPYTCENTEDKIYLLSYYEAFKSDYFSNNEERVATATDYAVARGASANASTDFSGSWWLRSPFHYDGNKAKHVGYDGSEGISNVDYNGYCIRPALWLNLGE